EKHEAPQAQVSPPLFVFLLGVVPRNRSAEIRDTSGETRGYDSGFYPELIAQFELRPLARDPGVGRALFLRGFYSHAVGIGSREKDCTEECQNYSTVFFRGGGDLGMLGDLGGIVELGVGIGFGFEAYQLADNPILPSVEYPYLRPALRARFRLAQELFVLDAEVAYRSLLGREEWTPAFGRSGDAFGMDISGGLSGVFGFGLAWRAEFAWVHYWHQFSGMGLMASGKEGSDSGIRITLALGAGIQ
ncbi:MAG: hypothetical protein NZM37_09165, partial [Sandaracinaceae bacterium]|nr:hypothetical protein [Sandaracinaceae bacterium]